MIGNSKNDNKTKVEVIVDLIVAGGLLITNVFAIYGSISTLRQMNKNSKINGK